MHSSYFKNFIATALMVIVSFLIMGTAFSFVSRRVFVMEARENVMSNAMDVAHTTAVYAADRDLDSLELRMNLTSIASGTGQHIFIVNPAGFVLSCSDTEIDCPHTAARMAPEVMEELSPTGAVTFLGTLNGFYEGEHYAVTVPLPDAEGNLQGYLFVSKDSVAALRIWEAMLPTFYLICLIVLCLALITSFASSKVLAQPLKAMTSAVRRFGRGDLSVRVEDTNRDDEIGELTQAFNSMADSLEKSEERRREFVANVSHELKTPMTTISGFADGILDGTIPPELEKKYLEIISSETKRLSRLVRSMLELSRLQAGDSNEFLSRDFDIAEVLRRTLVNFVDKIEEHRLDVDFQVPEEAMDVRGDIDAITQVVYNLLDNAIKFSHPETTLGISLWKDDNKAYVSVRNHGNTIPESEIPLLFDRFHKSDRSRSRDRDGVGLGLYIVKTILNNHGEDIAVTSRQGVTDFVFTLSLKP